MTDQQRKLRVTASGAAVDSHSKAGTDGSKGDSRAQRVNAAIDRSVRKNWEAIKELTRY